MTLIPGIKQISQVGNDMYIQGAFPVSVANTDVSYLADPADTRLLAGRDPVIEEVSVGMSGSETGIETASGAAPLQITDAMQGMLRFLETNIKPVQDLHGYANPWPAGGGSNKWDEEWELGTYDGNGEPSPSTVIIRTKNYIPITPSSEYYACVVSDENIAIYFYDSNKDYITMQTVKNATFTIPANAYYMRFRTATAYGTTYKHDIAINLPSSVTTYSPYSNICPITGWTGCNVYVSPTTNQADATLYPCTWQDDAGTVYGGYIDMISGFMTVTMVSVSDISQYNWQRAVTNIFYTVALRDIAKFPASNAQKGNIICSEYENYAYQALFQLSAYGISLRADDTTLRIKNLAVDTVPDCVAALSGVQIVFELATPQYYQVPGNQIMTREGTNYIWTDCGDTITAAYVAVK